MIDDVIAPPRAEPVPIWAGQDGLAVALRDAEWLATHRCQKWGGGGNETNAITNHHWKIKSSGGLANERTNRKLVLNSG